MKKLIKLMHADMDYVMVINPDHVVYLHDDHDICTIKLSTGDYFCTRTRAEDVARLIELSYK